MLPRNIILFSIPFIVAFLLAFGWFLFGIQLIKYVFIAGVIVAIVAMLIGMGLTLVDAFGDDGSH